MKKKGRMKKSVHIDIDLWKRLKERALDKTIKTNMNVTIVGLIEKAIKRYLNEEGE